jgi:aminoglycoside phosphotransferase (APT) family kinase protein
VKTFITQLARAAYGLDAQAVVSLEQHHFDWRGIYRFHDAQGGAWVMRLLRAPGALDGLAHTARLLAWLARQGFPAPSVRATVEGQPVALVDGWAIMVLGYVEGRVLGPHSAGFGRLAQTLGHLHALEFERHHGFALSRSNPGTVASAARLLETHSARVPAAFHAFAGDLHASMLALQRHIRHAAHIVHGDCWYLNAIETQDGEVLLIDWDVAGVGVPLLDLGYLLLTAHFDLGAPLVVAADPARIAEIMQGYQRRYRLAWQDRRHLIHALRFLPAFQLGSALASDELPPDFPFLLDKLQARYAATRVIAEVAGEHWA